MEVETRKSLSDLPDDILHHILSFLNLRNIARLRVLSRRFQTLSITAHSLSFTQQPPYQHNCSCTDAFNFMNNLLQHRPQASKINRLSFSCVCESEEHRRLHDQWIHKLFQTFHIDELSLCYQLPSIFQSLSRFQSLKSLKLEMPRLAFLKLPPNIKLASLETLDMTSLYTEDGVGEWVSQSFPSLKSLFLSNIYLLQSLEKQLDLAIRSSCLEDLTIQYCNTFKAVRIITENLRSLGYATLNNVEIELQISAPNLQLLSFSGSPPELSYDERTFKSLQVANITIWTFNNLNFLTQLIEAMRWARLVHIDTDLLKDLCGSPSISFGNIQHLQICVRRWCYHYKPFGISEEDYDNVEEVLINFMNRTSNIETLTFLSEPYSFNSIAAPEEYIFKEALKMLAEGTGRKEIKGAKKVKFKIRTMCHQMVLIIGMLKTRYVDLEEMTLNYPSCYHKSMTLYLYFLESASLALSINCVCF